MAELRCERKGCKNFNAWLIPCRWSCGWICILCDACGGKKATVAKEQVHVDKHCRYREEKDLKLD